MADWTVNSIQFDWYFNVINEYIENYDENNCDDV